MSWVAGIDFSTHAIDVVLIDENEVEPPQWYRYQLDGDGRRGQPSADAFDRTRNVPGFFIWNDDALAIGIEDPRGFGAGSLYRIQGAIIAALPRDTLVHPLIPSQWRKLCGMNGRATKAEVAHWAERNGAVSLGHWEEMVTGKRHVMTPQDCLDAYCIAVATRRLLERKEGVA